MKKMSEPKVCLCRDTMMKLFKHLRKTKSGAALWQLIYHRSGFSFAPFTRADLRQRKKPSKTMRKKPRTAKQKAATRKLVAFNKKRLR